MTLEVQSVFQLKKKNDSLKDSVKRMKAPNIEEQGVKMAEQ